MFVLKILVVITVIIKNSHCESETNFETTTLESDLDNNNESLFTNTEQTTQIYENFESTTLENEILTTVINQSAIEQEFEELNEKLFSLENDFIENDNQVLLVNENSQYENEEEAFESGSQFQNFTRESLKEDALETHPLLDFENEEKLLIENNNNIENEESTISYDINNEYQNIDLTSNRKEYSLYKEDQINENMVNLENFINKNDEIVENEENSKQINFFEELNENSGNKEKLENLLEEISTEEILDFKNNEYFYPELDESEKLLNFENLMNNQYKSQPFFENENFYHESNYLYENEYIEQIAEFDKNLEYNQEIMENPYFEYQGNYDYYMYEEQQNIQNPLVFLDVDEQITNLDKVFHEEDEINQEEDHTYVNEELPFYEEIPINYEQLESSTEENIYDISQKFDNYLLIKETTLMPNIEHKDHLILENDESLDNVFENTISKSEELSNLQNENLNNEENEIIQNNNLIHTESSNSENVEKIDIFVENETELFLENDKILTTETPLVEKENILNYFTTEYPLLQEEDNENLTEHDIIETNTEEIFQTENISENNLNQDYELPQENYFENYIFEKPLDFEEYYSEVDENTENLESHFTQEKEFNSIVEQISSNDGQTENMKETQIDNLKNKPVELDVDFVTTKNYSIENSIADQNVPLIPETNLHYQGDYEALENFYENYEYMIEESKQPLSPEHILPSEEIYSENYIDTTEQQLFYEYELDEKENYDNFDYYLYENYDQELSYPYNYVYPIENEYYFENNTENYIFEPDQLLNSEFYLNYNDNYNQEIDYIDENQETITVDNEFYEENYVYEEKEQKSSNPENLGFDYEYYVDESYNENELQYTDLDNLDFEYYIYKELEEYFYNYGNEDYSEESWINNNLSQDENFKQNDSSLYENELNYSEFYYENNNYKEEGLEILPEEMLVNYFNLENHNSEKSLDYQNNDFNSESYINTNEKLWTDQEYKILLKEKNYFENNFYQSDSEIFNLEAQVEFHKDKENMLQKENDLMKVEVENIQKAMKDLKETLFSEENYLENTFYHLNNENSNLKAQVKSLMKSKNILRKKNEHLRVETELLKEKMKTLKDYQLSLDEEINYLENDLYESENENLILEAKVTTLSNIKKELQEENNSIKNENDFLYETMKNMKDYEQSLYEENENLRTEIIKLNIEKKKCPALLPDVIEDLRNYKDFLKAQQTNFFKNLQNAVDILIINSFKCSETLEKCTNENNKLQIRLDSSQSFAANLLDEIIPIKIDNLKLQQFTDEIKQINLKEKDICNHNKKLIENFKFQIAHMQNEIDYLREYYVINTKILIFELIDELHEIREQNRKLRSKIPTKSEIILNLQNDYNETKTNEIFLSVLAENLKKDVEKNEMIILELKDVDNQKNQMMAQVINDSELKNVMMSHILFDNEQKDQMISKISSDNKEKDQMISNALLDIDEKDQIMSEILINNKQKDQMITRVINDYKYEINEMKTFNFELQKEKHEIESEKFYLERQIDYLEKEKSLLENENHQLEKEVNRLLQEKYYLPDQNEYYEQEDYLNYMKYNLEKENFELNIEKDNLMRQKHQLTMDKQNLLKEKFYLEKKNDNLERNQYYLEKKNDYFMKVKDQLESENYYLKRQNEYFERQKTHLEKQNSNLDEENQFIIKTVKSLKNSTSSEVLIDFNQIEELKTSYKNQIKDLKIYNNQLEQENSQLEQINYDLEQENRQLEKIKYEIEKEKVLLESLNNHLERNIEVHRLQDLATIQYSFNEYLFHKYEYEQMIEILNSLKYIQYMHQQVKSALLSYDQNNREQFEDFQNDQEELIENWENSNDTCIVAVFEKERKIERMSRLTKNLINEIEELQANLKKSHHSNCHDFFSDEMFYDSKQKEDAEDLLNKTSHLLKIIESTQMEQFDLKEQLKKFENLQNIEAIEKIVSQDSDLDSINKEIKIFWNNWDSRLEKNSMGVNFGRRSFKNEIDFKLYYDSKVAELMKELRKIDDEKLMIHESKNKKIMEAANLLKTFMETQQINKTISERIESNEEIIDYIETLKMQLENDDNKIHIKSIEIQDLFVKLKTAAEDEANNKRMTTYINIEIKVIQALLKKRDLLLKVRNNKINEELEAIIKKQEELIAEQKELKRTINEHIETLESISDAIRLFESELNMCQRRTVPEQTAKRNCEVEINEIEELKREIEELSKENKKCKTTFSLFPMLLG